MLQFKVWYVILICVSIIFTISCEGYSNKKNDSSNIKQKTTLQDSLENKIATRFDAPNDYTRSTLKFNSFGHYLRNLPLKSINEKVRYFNGNTKQAQNVYCGVVDLEIGNKNLHQCADAIIRLKAEYHWHQKEYDQIHFNFTNGFRVDYTEWMKGRRMIIEGNNTYWNNHMNPSNNYQDLWDYLELVFTYAGTASLEKELNVIDIKQATIGDVLIQGGHPGHAVIIVDHAIHEITGESIYLLAQSYMPAQEMQILINPNNKKLSPWYEFDKEVIKTPEWTFYESDFKRFP